MDQKNQLWIGVVVAVVLGAVVIGVAAQAPEIVPKEAKEAKAQAEAEAAAASAVEDGEASEPLSEKLGSNEGVIKPPRGIDPEIRVPPPAGGAMKLIVPPGAPGGEPTAQPH